MMPKSLGISLPSWVLDISGLYRHLGLSKVICGKVGSAYEHFYDEMEVMRLLTGTGRIYEIR